MDFYGWRPYVSVAERRAKAARFTEKLRKKGQKISPVHIEGRTIAKTFWGRSWCENLERYSDFENRLPRGRTYVRNGSVVDLQIAPGVVKALVSGSEIYKVEVQIQPLAEVRWRRICADCAGEIDSLVELLQGRFSKGVMERVTVRETGLFPAPKEIKLDCSCPDWATMCKHVAAVLYGIGARLDHQPELLFELRGVKAEELIAHAGKGLPLAKAAPAADKVLAGEDLAGMFGLDMAGADAPAAPRAAAKKAARPQPASPAETARPAAAKKAAKKPVKRPVKKAAKRAAKKAAWTKKPRPEIARQGGRRRTPTPRANEELP